MLGNINQENNLRLEPTGQYPGVDFRSDGNLVIWGRIVSDMLHDFFQPLNTWVENFEYNKIRIELNLEYLTSGGAFMLRDLLLGIENNTKIKDIEIKWYVEEDDEVHYELGELIKEKLVRSSFRFICHV